MCTVIGKVYFAFVIRHYALLIYIFGFDKRLGNSWPAEWLSACKGLLFEVRYLSTVTDYGQRDRGYTRGKDRKGFSA